jgi:hypothetical protein
MLVHRDLVLGHAGLVRMAFAAHFWDVGLKDLGHGVVTCLDVMSAMATDTGGRVLIFLFVKKLPMVAGPIKVQLIRPKVIGFHSVGIGVASSAKLRDLSKGWFSHKIHLLGVRHVFVKGFRIAPVTVMTGDLLFSVNALLEKSDGDRILSPQTQMTPNAGALLILDLLPPCDTGPAAPADQQGDAKDQYASPGCGSSLHEKPPDSYGSCDDSRPSYRSAKNGQTPQASTIDLVLRVPKIDQDKVQDQHKDSSRDDDPPSPRMALGVLVKKWKEHHDQNHDELSDDPQNLWCPCADKTEILGKLKKLVIGQKVPFGLQMGGRNKRISRLLHGCRQKDREDGKHGHNETHHNHFLQEVVGIKRNGIFQTLFFCHDRISLIKIQFRGTVLRKSFLLIPSQGP